MRRLVWVVVVLTAAIAGALPAAADMAHSRVVSPNPVDWTPHVTDGSVRAVVVVGETVVVGGDFSGVTDAAGRRSYERWFLFAFDRRTGAIRDSFAPELDGPVYALAAGASGTVYLGGSFRTVNGVTQPGLARLDVANGARLTNFRASIDCCDVRTLAAYGRWLYAGGTFRAIGGVARSALARLDSTSGAVDPGFDARLAAPELGRVKVEDMALSPDGGKLVAIGAITQAGGVPRAQLVMIDTIAARVADWYTDAYRPRCRASFLTYLRGVDFSPDGSYFAVVTTGRMTDRTRLCDTTARFETAGRGRHDPTWVNHTGGDSLYSVAITGSAVYVGGHQRWLDNPEGRENAGPGAVYRPGIGAIDARSGRALPWNPTRARGVGVRAFAATPDGLFVGSDTETLGREHHGRIGLFPLS